MYLIPLLIFIQAKGMSQTDRLKQIQKDCKCPEFDKEQYFTELLDISKSPNEIEIRLVQYSMTYTQYSIISYNKGKYNAVYYRNKLQGVHTIQSETKIRNKSPYYRYSINNKKLEAVMSYLIKDSVFNWVDPGFINRYITDLGFMKIYYKNGNITGSYKFQPPFALLSIKPELEAYKRLDRMTKVIYLMTDSVRILTRKLIEYP